MSLVLLPVYLMWLRILNSMKKRYAKKRIYAGVISTAYIVIIFLLVLINYIFYSDKKEGAKNIQVISASKNEYNRFDFSLSYSDRYVFEDIIRQIKIDSSVLPVYSCVKVTSPNPILYSENDYILSTPEEAEFLLPLYPSSQLEFNYGTDQPVQTIDIEQIFYSETDNKYYSLTKSLRTEAVNER